MSCELKERYEFGLRIITLENDTLRAEILAGKGGDIYSLTYKPLDADILLKSPEGLSQYEGRDLSQNRLKWYSEMYTGGWNDVLPGFAVYKDVSVGQEDSGIAATLPWEVADTEVSAGSASITLKVNLPLIPLSVTKRFSISKGASSLKIDEQVCNTGDAPVRFTWVQHAAFAGKLIGDDTVITLPSNRVFQGRRYRREDGLPLYRYEAPVSEIPLDDGSVHDMRKPIPKEKSAFFVAALREIKETEYSISRPSLGLSAKVTWDRVAFPYLRCWYSGTKNGSSVALEPANHFAGCFDDAYNFGGYTTLEPGQEIKTWLGCELN